MWRYPIATLLALHGLVHVIGVAVYWKLAEPADFTYPTSLLDGRLDAPTTVVWIMGGGWLIATAGFLLAAAGLIRAATWTTEVVLASVLLSLVLCVLAMPEAVAGIALNLAIAGGLGLLQLVHHLPREQRRRTA
jgi:hypothetical protein